MPILLLLFPRYEKYDDKKDKYTKDSKYEKYSKDGKYDEK
jgi:hypothetical protein